MTLGTPAGYPGSRRCAPVGTVQDQRRPGSPAVELDTLGGTRTPSLL